jgi:hypothetical protein
VQRVGPVPTGFFTANKGLPTPLSEPHPFEFDLHPLGQVIYGGPVFYPAEHAFDLLRAFCESAADAPDEIAALVNLTSAPPLPVIPEE